MRAPLSWLRQHTDLSADTGARTVQAVLVRVGLEEEGLHGGDVTGPVVVGEVLELTAEPQKNGKTINWCTVRVAPGDGPGAVRGIVCGAHNFAVGDRVVVALPGAVLPGGFAISARKTYGHVSDGMICSSLELGVGDDHDGIIVLSPADLVDVEPGDDALALLGLDDVTIEVNVTPDRGYCFSLRGIAREYALSAGGAFRDPAEIAAPAGNGAGHLVRLADDAPLRGREGCSRYVARTVRGVDASAASPQWMQRLLQQCGMRPISLVVDVTNYVMLATGQPLHAFDRALLQGPVVVRRARQGERLTTLDGTERRLDPEDLLITDEDTGGASRVLAIAGVMGGASTEVSSSTTDVLVEAAHFDPVTVARSARRHKLATEAGRRFERGVDTDLADRAAELAVRLLVEHGGGTADAGVTDVDRRPLREPVRMAADLPTRLIGLDLTAEQVDDALSAVGCSVERERDVVVALPPSWRPDLREGADLVEEVARVVGYDSIPIVLPVAPPGRGLTRGQRLRRSASRTLAEQGLVEVLTLPFVDPARHDAMHLPADDSRRSALRLVNPLNDQAPELRTSLLATLVDAARRNLARGVRDLALFEVGTVVRPRGHAVAGPMPPSGERPDDQMLAALDAGVPPQPMRAAALLAGHRDLPGWWGPGRVADWTDAVDVVQAVSSALGLGRLVVSADRHDPWHPGRCARLALADGTLVGHAGELAPAVLTALELPERTCAVEVDLDVLFSAVPDVVVARPLATHPMALRDVALLVDADVPAATVEAALREGAGELLEELRLFDEYRGEQVPQGMRSLAYRLVLRAPDRTLTGDEATAARDAAVRHAAELTGAELRAG